MVHLRMYPRGYMTKLEYLDSLGPTDWKTKDIMESVFEIFDEDGNEKMDFEEFLMASSAMKQGSPCFSFTYFCYLLLFQ